MSVCLFAQGEGGGAVIYTLSDMAYIDLGNVDPDEDVKNTEKTESSVVYLGEAGYSC